mgnify:CR=1 FL=1
MQRYLAFHPRPVAQMWRIFHQQIGFMQGAKRNSYSQLNRLSSNRA